MDGTPRNHELNEYDYAFLLLDKFGGTLPSKWETTRRGLIEIGIENAMQQLAIYQSALSLQNEDNGGQLMYA
jgi:hypothetical protein